MTATAWVERRLRSSRTHLADHCARAVCRQLDQLVVFERAATCRFRRVLRYRLSGVSSCRNSIVPASAWKGRAASWTSASARASRSANIGTSRRKIVEAARARGYSCLELRGPRPPGPPPAVARFRRRNDRPARERTVRADSFRRTRSGAALQGVELLQRGLGARPDDGVDEDPRLTMILSASGSLNGFIVTKTSGIDADRLWRRLG